jgi:GntR family transcriptional regulator, transcriptional repressor for pyruvate dehydrogenase complex
VSRTARDGAAEPAVFSQIEREPRLSDKVAGLLRASIVDRRLQPGDRLPTERELGDQFGVSRTVVREAVRTLVAKGLVEVRSGSGVYVSSVDESAVRESMNMFLLGAGIPSYQQIHDVRSVLEVEIAAHAAEKATEDDLVALANACDDMAASIGDIDAASAADVDFHRRLAAATYNPLFSVMIDSIGDVLLEIRKATLGIGERAAKGVQYHRDIYERVAAHDVEGARTAMRVHLEDAREAWLRIESDQAAAR